MTDLPQPLTPADCNLTDFQFMPMDVHRLLASETWVLGNGEEKAAAITLWLASWHQIPAGSIPNAARMLAHLSQAGPKWSKVKLHALRGWVQASDGRLYHAVVAEKVLEAWIEKLANSLAGATGNAKRWGVVIDTDLTRAQFIEAVSMLRAIAPQSKTLKKKIVATIAAGSPPDSPPDDTKPSPPDSPGDRKGQGQGQGQGIEKKEQRKPKPPAAPSFDPRPDLVAQGVAEQTIADWLVLRKKKGAPVTPTVLSQLVREATSAGLSLDATLALCCVRGWTGFEASWVQKDARAAPPGASTKFNPTAHVNRNRNQSP